MTSEINSSQNPFLGILELWLKCKQQSVNLRDDWKMYEELLRDSLRELSINYAKGKKEWYLLEVGRLIRIAKRELAFINEDRKKKEIPF